MYEKITGSIAITVEPAYMDDQSSPADSRFFWAYTVKIENRGAEAVRLRSRYWRITDANGHIQEVTGEGVIGEQPLLAPGGNYQYTSGAPLPTPSGFMTGNYTMEDSVGRPFTVDIPAFSLDSPHQIIVLN